MKKRPKGGNKSKRVYETVSTDSKQEEKSNGHPLRRTLAILFVLLVLVFLLYFSYPSSFTRTFKKEKSSTDDPIDQYDEDEGFGEHGKDKRAFVPRQYYTQNTAMEPKMAAVITNLSRDHFPSLEVSIMLEELFQKARTDAEYIELLFLFGLRYLNMEHYVQGLLLFEEYFEMKLGVDDWFKLVESIIDQHEDEWVFLYDVGDNVTEYISLALKCCLYTQEYVKADYMYRLLIGLSGPLNVPEYTRAYAAFSISIGNIWTAVKNYKLNSMSLFVSEGLGDDHDAHNVITSHGLRLFTSGLPMYAASLTRSLILGKHKVWATLKENCGIKEDHLVQSVFSKIYFGEVIDLFTKCTQYSKTIEKLVEEGSVIYASNLFGWVPLLQATFVGGDLIVYKLLENGADPLTHTQLGHTSLHVAAMHGKYSIVPKMLDAGLSAEAVDYFNRTALDIACLHGKLNAERLVSVLKTPPSSSPLCSRKTLSHKGTKMGMGGWLPSYTALPGELTDERCDFDSIADLNADSFLYNYLLLQRPVLVRNAINATAIKRFLKQWERGNFEKTFGFLQVPLAGIPLSQQLGLPSEYAFISSLLQLMKTVYQRKSKSDVLLEELTKIVYLKLDPFSSLLDGFQLPPVLDSNTSHISYSGVMKYLYLGTVASGFNMAFGKAAWDLMVYGQKRWFLYPPSDSYFTTEHPWSWWKGTYKDEGGALECVQNSGDLLFVPEVWSRSSLHLRESVGLFQEFVHGPTEFSI